MYIDVVPNRNSPPAILLRETRRVGKRSVKRTVANLSACPLEAVEAVLGMMRKVGMDVLLASRRNRKTVHRNGKP